MFLDEFPIRGASWKLWKPHEETNEYTSIEVYGIKYEADPLEHLSLLEISLGDFKTF